jgi:nitrile hydratase
MDNPTRREFLATAGALAAAPLVDAASHDHHRDHDHQHQAVPSDSALRVKALDTLLVAKGVIDRAEVDQLVDRFEHQVGPRIGARVVARAWVDPAFKQRLLADAGKAVAELGIGSGGEDRMLALENTPAIHNLVVCTLCSCYPWSVLGLPPVWYKSTAYRSRAVIDPRGVLKEFGLDVPEQVEVRVWDSTAEQRYMVLPERPAGSEQLSEEALTALVTRDSMVGTGKVTLSPDGGPR